MSAVRFPYIEADPALGLASRQPFLPIRLEFPGGGPISTLALIDSGASLNVLPYTIGLRMGADWDAPATSVRLTGNLAAVEAKVLITVAVVATFPPVRLAFAWSRSDSIPVLLGQVNFFHEFDVCFFGSRAEFEVGPKA